MRNILYKVVIITFILLLISCNKKIENETIIQDLTDYPSIDDYFEVNTENEPVKVVQDVNLLDYMPFSVRIEKTGYTPIKDLNKNDNLHLSDNNKAITDITEMIKIEPRNPDNYFNRGVLYLEIGEEIKALSDFELALMHSGWDFMMWQRINYMLDKDMPVWHGEKLY